jgi:hypothetical protein
LLKKNLAVKKGAYSILLQQTFEGGTARATVRPSDRTCQVSSKQHTASDYAPKNQIIKTPLGTGREKPKKELMSLMSALEERA